MLGKHGNEESLAAHQLSTCRGHTQQAPQAPWSSEGRQQCGPLS